MVHVWDLWLSLPTMCLQVSNMDPPFGSVMCVSIASNHFLVVEVRFDDEEKTLSQIRQFPVPTTISFLNMHNSIGIEAV